MKIWRCPKCKSRQIKIKENELETLGESNSTRDLIKKISTVTCAECGYRGKVAGFRQDHAKNDFGDDCLVRGDVKIDLSNLGEGLGGDYNPENENDVNLLRFDIDKYDRAEQRFVGVEDASYCTQIPAYATPKQRREALKFLMDEIHEAVANGESVKKPCERLSWISLDSIKENAIAMGRYCDYKKARVR